MFYRLLDDVPVFGEHIGLTSKPSGKKLAGRCFHPVCSEPNWTDRTQKLSGTSSNL
jgi:hypothetical protein